MSSLIILQSGGPTAVINATLYGIISEAQRTKKFSRIFGAVAGFEGLSAGNWVDVTGIAEQNIEIFKSTPGMALGSSRSQVDEKALHHVVDRLVQHSVDCVLVIGGNGSMLTPLGLYRIAGARGYALRVLGVPKTVDNDLIRTDHSPGYGSAARVIARAVQDSVWDLKTLPAESVRIMEIMGRNTGWLAAAAWLAGDPGESGPDYVLTPEVTFHHELFLQRIGADLKRNRRIFITAAEGLRTDAGTFLAEESGFVMKDKIGRVNPGFTSGVGHVLAKLIYDRFGCRVRYDKPGTLQRSGLDVSLTDRAEAELIGRNAVTALLEGESGKMIGFIRRPGPYRTETGLFPLEEVAGKERTIPAEFYVADRLNPAMVRDYVGPLIGEPLQQYKMLI